MSNRSAAAETDAPATRRASPALLVALLAPLALLAGGRWGGDKPLHDQPLAPVPKSRPPEQICHCLDRFVAPIVGLTGVPIDTRSGDWKLVLDQARVALEAMGGPSEVRTMIATIPDPIDSGLVYLYDVELQALELAMEVQIPAGARAIKYFRDRSWLPWDDRYQEGDDRKASEDCRQQTPGLILLRGDPGVMALLLVGESPTVGVHRNAMDRALIAESILNAAHRREPCDPGKHEAAEGCTRIVGPTFSGSASSLARALRARDDLQRGVQIISGTASGPAVPGLLRINPHPGWGAITYQATTVPEQATECSFLHLVDRLGARRIPAANGGPELVEATAVLSESGTEFGTGIRQTTSPCDQQPEVHLWFPFHVAALRDAYAEQEKQIAPTTQVEETIARRTSLPVSLHENRTALDVPANPSSKTVFAQDVALSHVLSEISREGIRYVAIEATDAADSIFLAQKIRDVAPDVRLVFLDSDALLTHPDFEQTLLGSFVISPYPFLGADDFVPRLAGVPVQDASVVPHSHAPFENANAEGVFNAVLAQRGLPPEMLQEYVFAIDRDQTEAAAARLPLWISTIGHGELVPVATRPSVDCAGTIYGREQVPGQDQLCDLDRTPAERTLGWDRFNALQLESLQVDPDVTPPRFWDFVFATLIFGFLLDRYFGNRAEAQMAPAASDRDNSPGSDRDIDVSVGRAKLLFYLFVRRLALFIGLVYMSVVTGIAVRCFKSATPTRVTLEIIGVAVPVLIAGRNCLLILCRFQREYRRLRGWCRRFPPGVDTTNVELGAPASAWFRPLLRGRTVALRALGFEPVDRLQSAASTPFARIRTLRAVVLVIGCTFLIGLFASLGQDIDAKYWHRGSVPALTLFVLRTLPLTNGVSFAAPALLSILCAYIWATGRVARLRLAHGLSRITPDDGLRDGVSTPLCRILYPQRRDGLVPAGDPDGFGRAERALLNAIWSPGASVGYFYALLLVVFFPLVLFSLKPPSSLDRLWDTRLLAAAMGICGVLVSATLIQLGEYWLAFSAVLRRIANHPFAGAFKNVLPFMRQPLDAQLSRFPDDLSRLVACTNAYRDLPDPGRDTEIGMDLAMRRQLIDEAAGDALNQRARRGCEASAAAEARLGRLLIEAAAALTTELLERTAAEKAAPWRTAARRWVVTVATVAVNRHVRQFRHFLYTTTGCAVVLLIITLSYPFEPQRAMLTCLWGLTLIVAFSSLAVFVMMSRDTLLSYITKTKPGQLDLNAVLLGRVLQWVVVPLLLVAAAQYPTMANTVFKWVDPLLHALR